MIPKTNNVSSNRAAKGTNYQNPSTPLQKKRDSKNKEKEPSKILKKGAFSTNMGHFTNKNSKQNPKASPSVTEKPQE
jgi:hypothetical protein